MTDFKGFNPDKNLGANFNTNRHNKNTKPETQPEQAEAQPGSDPYANLKMDPDRMMDLLSAQAKSNNIKFSGVGNAGSIEKSVAAFETSVSPERHSLVSRMLEQTFESEFGKKPPVGILQDMVDDYLIGQVLVQPG